MLFGPLPVVFAEKLRQLLQSNGSDGKIFHNMQEAQEADFTRKAVLNQSPQPYPIFEGGRDLVYIEIQTKDLLIVRGELDKMGFSIPAREATPIPGEDFLCPRCDFHSDAPGSCPRDGTALVTFSEWANRKRFLNRRRDRIIAWLILTAMAIPVVLRVYSYFKDRTR